MKKDFLEYIQNEFNFTDEEIKNFEEHIEKPLKKSIRVNTNKISSKDFQNHAKSNNWTLSSTSLWNNTFYIDREDLEFALWNTPEHISWLFYIQELAASSSPFYLSWDKIDTETYTILDMSASPWWKTTSLSEYYPNSLIVANELLRPRLKWLFLNLNRMWSTNTVVTNYDWRFFRTIPETFDKILLDAPCSWEWTAFKSPETVKYWNIKNIKKICKLQIWLLESAVISLKTWWEIVYSTCTLNKFENEHVIQKVLDKYPDSIEIVPVTKDEIYKRNWQHLDFTWWFFVAKLKKVKEIDSFNKDIKIKNVRQNIEKLARKESKFIKKFIKERFSFDCKWYYLYKYKTNIYLTNRNLDNTWDKLFLYQTGIIIWDYKNSEFIPDFYLWTIKKFDKWTIEVKEDDLNKLYSWYDIDVENKDWYYQIIAWENIAWIAKVKNKKLKSLIDNNLIRK